MSGAQGNTFQTYININDENNDLLSPDQQNEPISEKPQENHKQPENINEENTSVLNSMDESMEHRDKLCGYLRKYKFEIYGQMGRLMSTRYRRCWFVLADSTCMLLYYASPQEHTPLGQIDIAAASFSFDLANRHGQWTFVISSRGQKYCLGANDHQSLRFWLQELQKRRSEYSQWKIRLSSHNKRSLQEPHGGLMRENHTGLSANNSGLITHHSTSPDCQTNNNYEGKHYPEAAATHSTAKDGNIGEGGEHSDQSSPVGGIDGETSVHNGKMMSEMDGQNCGQTNEAATSGDDDVISKETIEAGDTQDQLTQEETAMTEADFINAIANIPNTAAAEVINANIDESKTDLTVGIDVTNSNVDEPKTATKETDDTSGSIVKQDNSAEIDNVDVIAASVPETSPRTFDLPQRAAATVKMRLQNLPFAKYYKAQLGNVVAEHELARNTGSTSPTKRRSYETERDTILHNLLSSSGVEQTTESRLAPLKRFLRPRSFHSATSGCRKCKDYEELLSCEHQTVKARSEELAATREVMKILQKHIDMLERQRLTQFKFCLNACEEQWLSMLQEKDAHAVQLEHLLALRDEEMQLLREQIKCADVEMTNLTQQASMYGDIIRAKDQMVVSLTHRLQSRPASWEMVEPPPPAAAGRDGGEDAEEGMAERQRLQDACGAFEEQNGFLNSEILELNKLREDDETREKDLCMKYAELEASYCQLESKYLLCVRELQKPRRGGDSSSEELVTRLLEDAMESSESLSQSALVTGGRAQHSQRGHSVAVFDKYGFTRMPVYALDDSLEERAKNLQRLSDKLSSRQQDVNLEISNEVKWETYIVNQGQRPVLRSQELKTLIRSGVPVQHRELIWNVCINLRIGKWREQFGKCYYEELLQRCKDTAMLNPALKQIELDLLRTLPTNRHYQILSCEGIIRLRRLLSAYSMHNPIIGYCQGINRLAALALLFLNEEDAFWCLVAIVENIMPSEYYSSTLAAAHADQGVLKELLQEKLPRLHAHLVQHRVDVSLFSFNWFLTVFVDNVPTDVYLRIWDAFLYEGSKVLFRFAVAFFKYNEQTLLDTCDSMSLYTYLRTMPEDIVNVNKLAQIAFDELNPFPMRFISAKRQTHMLLVKCELKRLDSQRGCTLQEQRSRSDFVSDDEN